MQWNGDACRLPTACRQPRCSEAGRQLRARSTRSPSWSRHMHTAQLVLGTVARAGGAHRPPLTQWSHRCGLWRWQLLCCVVRTRRHWRPCHSMIRRAGAWDMGSWPGFQLCVACSLRCFFRHDCCVARGQTMLELRRLGSDRLVETEAPPPPDTDARSPIGGAAAASGSRAHDEPTLQETRWTVLHPQRPNLSAARFAAVASRSGRNRRRAGLRSRDWRVSG